MTNPMQQRTDEIRQMILGDIQKGQERIFPALLHQYQPNVLPEEIFRDYFLDRFLGVVQDPTWVVQWINIAGAPSAEVSIIDKEGKELFRVPPAISSIGLGFNVNQRGSVPAMFSHANNLSNNSPVQALTFVSQTLHERSQLMLSTGATLTDSQRWAAILARYDRLPQEVTIQQASSSGSDDIFEF